MDAQTLTRYQDLAQDYLERFRGLSEVPEAPRAARRGAAEVPAEILVERADEIADVSARMVPLAGAVLQDPDPALREGMSGQLLSQAAAELQVAAALLALPDETPRAAPTTRAPRSAQLRQAIDALEQTMTLPLDRGLPVAAPSPRAAVAALTVDQAKETLQTTTSTTVTAIARRVQDLGGDIALNLILNTEWAVVLEGASLLRKDVGEKLDKVKEGATALVEKAVNTAARTLLNVYDKILVLMGEDVEAAARKRVQAWLETLKDEEQVDVFDAMVDRLYQIDGVNQRVVGWLGATTVGADVLGQTAADVQGVGEKFGVLVEHMDRLQTAMVLAKGIKIPQVLLVVTAVQVALLGVVVYAGYDYIGGREPGFLNVTEGVSEILQERLAV
jgi:hypothetical protein